jgi:hypothetical protein
VRVFARFPGHKKQTATGESTVAADSLRWIRGLRAAARSGVVEMQFFRHERASFLLGEASTFRGLSARAHEPAGRGVAGRAILDVRHEGDAKRFGRAGACPFVRVP